MRRRRGWSLGAVELIELGDARAEDRRYMPRRTALDGVARHLADELGASRTLFAAIVGETPDALGRGDRRAIANAMAVVREIPALGSLVARILASSDAVHGLGLRLSGCGAENGLSGLLATAHRSENREALLAEAAGRVALGAPTEIRKEVAAALGV